MTNDSSMCLGLCCSFLEQPIKFRNTTVKAIHAMKRDAALTKLSGLCLANAEALQASLRFCADNGISCFRINSQILPVKTHAECGYDVFELPDGEQIARRFKACGEFARDHDLRTCFHPDQFVVLNSPNPDVVDRSLLREDVASPQIDEVFKSLAAQPDSESRWAATREVGSNGDGSNGDRALSCLQSLSRGAARF